MTDPDEDVGPLHVMKMWTTARAGALPVEEVLTTVSRLLDVVRPPVTEMRIEASLDPEDPDVVDVRVAIRTAPHGVVRVRLVGSEPTRP